jgi:Fe-S cluster assembly protein SufD
VLSPQLADALPGPDWLQARRRAALDVATTVEGPSAEQEVWRYSRIGELDLDAFAPLAPAPDGEAPADLPVEVVELLASLAERSGAVVTVDGRLVLAELDERLAARGAWFGPLADAPDAEVALGAVSGEPQDLLTALNEATAAQPVLLRLPAGAAVEAPFVLVDWIATEGVLASTRLVVQAGDDSEATVVDWHGSADVAALSLPVVELDLAPAARLSYLNVQDRGPQVWQVAWQASRVDAQATLTAVQAGLGGSYARARTDCRLVGRGATGNLLAAYFGERDQMLDYRTFQDHVAPDTTSNLLFKGAVGGRSRSVYTGLIRVGREARGTNAFQTNRNIKLSEGAWAESVPNLEIENNDVHCSHASTVGPVDEDQRFYLESRGVPGEAAERLLVSGFFDEVLERLPVSTVARLLELEIDGRLARRDA